MSIKTIIGLLVVTTVLSACHFMAQYKYHIGKEMSFKTKKDYLSYIEKKRIISAQHILYLDLISLEDFYSDKIKNDNSLVYQGSYLNDSVCIKKSFSLEENKSCSGRMVHEIKENLLKQQYPDSVLCKTKKLSSYKLYYLHNNESFVIEHNNKKLKVFLLYSYRLGSYYNRFYKQMLQLQTLNSSLIDIYLICIDRIPNI